MIALVAIKLTLPKPIAKIAVIASIANIAKFAGIAKTSELKGLLPHVILSARAVVLRNLGLKKRVLKIQ